MQQEWVELKDGRRALLRAVRAEDAEALVEEARRVGAEGRHVIFDEPWSVEFQREYAEKVSPERRFYWTAEVDGRPIAVIDVERYHWRKLQDVTTLGMWIAPGYREVGLGGHLIRKAFEWAREQGVRKVCLEVFGSNERAQTLYRKMGFVEEGRRKGQIRLPDGTLTDEILMAYWI